MSLFLLASSVTLSFTSQDTESFPHQFDWFQPILESEFSAQPHSLVHLVTSIQVHPQLELVFELELELHHNLAKPIVVYCLAKSVVNVFNKSLALLYCAKIY